MIEVNSTDDLLVHATNSMDQPTSIHHHGMFFNSTSWMDGAVGVSQWLVAGPFPCACQVFRLILRLRLCVVIQWYSRRLYLRLLCAHQYLGSARILLGSCARWCKFILLPPPSSFTSLKYAVPWPTLLYTGPICGWSPYRRHHPP